MRYWVFHILTPIILLISPLLAFSAGDPLDIDSLEFYRNKELNDSSDFARFYSWSRRIRYSYPDEAERLIQIGITKAKRKKDLLHQGLLEDILGDVYWHKGQLDQSKKAYRKAIQIFDRNKDSINAAYVRANLGYVYMEEANFTEALSLYQTAYDVGKKAGNTELMFINSLHLASVHMKREEFENALLIYDEALTQIDSTIEPANVSTILMNKGNALLMMDRLDEAKANYLAALKMKRSLGDKRGTALTLTNLSSLLLEQKKHNEAITYLKESIGIFKEIDNPRSLQIAHNNLGECYYKTEQFALAEKNFREALSISEQVKIPDMIKKIHFNLGELFEKTGQFEKSVFHFKESMRWLDSLKQEQKLELEEELSRKFESERNKTKIESLEKEKKLQEEQLARSRAESEKDKAQKRLFIFLLLGSILLLTFTSYSFIQKRKDNLKLKDQKKIIEEKSDHLETALEEITQSVHYARTLQSAFIPGDQQFRKLFNEFFSIYLPKDIVSGDFIWLKEKDNYCYLAVGDCTGHGIPGAMVSIICSNALNAVLMEKNAPSPNEILDRTAEIVERSFQMTDRLIRDGMDISLIRIFSNNGLDETEIEFSAANNPIWIVRENSNEVLEIKADKQPIGAFENRKPFTLITEKLKKGDTVYLLSDGYADQFGGEKGKKYRYNRLKEKMLEIRSFELTRQKEILLKEFNDWKGDYDQLDDITIIGFRI